VYRNVEVGKVIEATQFRVSNRVEREFLILDIIDIESVRVPRIKIVKVKAGEG